MRYFVVVHYYTQSGTAAQKNNYSIFVSMYSLSARIIHTARELSPCIVLLDNLDMLLGASSNGNSNSMEEQQTGKFNRQYLLNHCCTCEAKLDRKIYHTLQAQVVRVGFAVSARVTRR